MTQAVILQGYKNSINKYHVLKKSFKSNRYMNPRAKPGEPYQATFPESVANVITHAVSIKFLLPYTKHTI